MTVLNLAMVKLFVCKMIKKCVEKDKKSWPVAISFFPCNVCKCFPWDQQKLRVRLVKVNCHQINLKFTLKQFQTTLMLSFCLPHIYTNGCILASIKSIHFKLLITFLLSC